MDDIIDNELAWELFAHTGSIEGYLLYNELRVRNNGDGHNKNDSTGFENLQYER